jgi:hypothetical protein
MGGVANIARAARRRLAAHGDENSVSYKKRSARFDEMLRRFPKLADMAVLDLGGEAHFWESARARPAHVTTVNLLTDPELGEWHTHITADACLFTPRRSYDLVLSNSLIEHVGGYRYRQQLAHVIRGAAPAYWVQTPNRYFPIEPHYMAPGFQFVPLAWRAQLIARWPLTWHQDPSVDHAFEEAASTELLGASELCRLFPDGELWREKMATLTKSLVVVRGG